jgi:hypothetical protein
MYACIYIYIDSFTYTQVLVQRILKKTDVNIVNSYSKQKVSILFEYRFWTYTFPSPCIETYIHTNIIYTYTYIYIIYIPSPINYSIMLSFKSLFLISWCRQFLLSSAINILFQGRNFEVSTLSSTFANRIGDVCIQMYIHMHLL